MASFAPRRTDDASSRAWTSFLQRLDEAVAAQDISLAERAWHDAYVQPLGSRRWDGMVEAGDAALRIARDLAGADPEAEARVHAWGDQVTRGSAAAHEVGKQEP